MRYTALALEILSVAFALAYLVLAIRQSLWCWPAALISVVLATLVFFDARLYMESALQIFYFAMAIYGWQQWRQGKQDEGPVRIHWWHARRHVIVISAIVAVSALFGWLLGFTNAALPFVDSFTTVAAVVTTYMVARKVMENWIYWLVIDSILVWLYLERGLNWYAALYAFYLVLIVIGFRAWLKDWRGSRVQTHAAGA